MTDMINAEISESLKALRDKYPNQKVAIRAVLEPGLPIEYFASVEHLDAPIDYQSRWSSDPHDAVERLIALVGNHDRMESITKRQKELQVELDSIQRTMKALGAVACGDNEESHPTEGCGHHQPTV